jgi:hypothetical protein
VSTLPAPSGDLRDFPTFGLQPDQTLFRIHQAVRGPWWFGADGQGRFDLSFKSNPGFELGGESFGNSLIVESGRDLLRLDGAERIAAAGSAPYRIYVRKNSEWKPADPARALLAVQ